MKLLVDESQTARRINFVHEEIPVRSGRVALAYPKWIPGEHGPIEQLGYVRIKTGTSALRWERDADDINTLYVDVPQGVDRIDVDFTTAL